mgnify:CR=1 FL=1
MFDLVVAECRRCGVKRYSFTEEDALAKLEKHICTRTLLDDEIDEIIDKLLHDN